jgi:hypothetical protein
MTRHKIWCFLEYKQSFLTLLTVFPLTSILLLFIDAQAISQLSGGLSPLALRGKFVVIPESYDSFCIKSCIFFAHQNKEEKKPRTVWGIFLHLPYTTRPKARYQNIPKTFNYYSRTITNLTNIWHRTEQPWKSHTWIFCLSFAIFEIALFGDVTKGSQTLWG